MQCCPAPHAELSPRSTTLSLASSPSLSPPPQARLDGLQAELEARRERLAATAEQLVLQPIATAADIRAGAGLLLQVAGAQHAHSVVLEAHAGEANGLGQAWGRVRVPPSTV